MMNITKVVPDFNMTDLDCNKTKEYLTSVLQIMLDIPNARSNVVTRSLHDGVEFSYYLPMIDSDINGVLNKSGTIVVDKLPDDIIVATLNTGSRSYLIKNDKFIDARENGDVFIKHGVNVFLVTSYGNSVYCPEFEKNVTAVVNVDKIPYNSLNDAFVMVKLNGVTEFYEGVDGIKYLNFVFEKTNLPAYMKSINSWIGSLFK